EVELDRDELSRGRKIIGRNRNRPLHDAGSHGSWGRLGGSARVLLHRQGRSGGNQRDAEECGGASGAENPTLHSRPPSPGLSPANTEGASAVPELGKAGYGPDWTFSASQDG